MHVQWLVNIDYEYYFNLLKFNLGSLKELPLVQAFIVLYVNDINCGISYKLQLFADDCFLYFTINSQNDHLYLQSDLDSWRGAS